MGILRRKKKKNDSRVVRFDTGQGLPSADAIYETCMSWLNNDIVCRVIKGIYCRIVPDAEGCGGSLPCSEVGQSCVTSNCCAGLVCESETQVCQLP